jgi:TonB family protein
MTRNLAAVLALAAFSLLPMGLCASNQADFEYALKQKYAGKSVLLRGFYRGDQLDYDAQGNYITGGSAGTWTLDGVLTLIDFKLRGGRLEIAADRDVTGFSYHHRKLYALPDKPVEIVVHTGPGLPALEGAAQTLAKVFMLEVRNPAEFTPLYWKPIIENQTWAEFAKRPQKPPHKLNLLRSGALLDGEPVYYSDGIAQSGLGGSQPSYAPSPYYPEQARLEKRQGTVPLAVVVGLDGSVKDVLRLGEQLGGGLDQSAINTVRRWRFQPPRDNVGPANVVLPISVTFSLK